MSVYIHGNPIIAGVFRRAGLIEKWGRGTNRAIAMCREAGIRPPAFEEITGAAVVTYRVYIAGPQKVAPTRSEVGSEKKVGGRATQLMSELESQLESKLESLEQRVLRILRDQPAGKAALAAVLGQKQASGLLHEAIRALLAQAMIERTIPDKPNSRLQKYRLSQKGRRVLGERKGAAK